MTFAKKNKDFLICSFYNDFLCVLRLFMRFWRSWEQTTTQLFYIFVSRLAKACSKVAFEVSVNAF